MRKRPVWQYFLVIVAAAFFLRLPLLWIPIIDVDEAIYALFAKIWFTGGIPYIDCVETKPLGIYFLYGIMYRFFGSYHMLAVHIFTAVWVCLTSYILYLIVKQFSSARAGIFAALFYSVYTTTYTPKIIATTIEPVMMLPIALHIFLWLKFEETKDLKFASYSGVALSVALLLKYQAGINLVLMLAYLFIIHPIFIKDTPLWTRLKGFFNFSLALIPLSAIMLLHLFKIGALKEFEFWTIGGSFDYIMGGSSSINLLHQLATRVLPFFAWTFLLWGFLLISVKQFAKRNVHRNEWFILLWLLLCIVPVMAGRRFYGHYFIIILPPLCVLAGHQLDIWLQSHFSKPVKRFLALAILLPAFGCLVPRFFLDPLYKTVGEDNPKDYEPIAEYVANHTSSEQRVAVWGYAPLIYWYSDRLPATRFFWSDLLVGRVPGAKPERGGMIEKMPISSIMWQMFFDDLEKHKPIYFIDTAPAGLHDYAHYPISDYPELVNYLRANYKEEAVLEKSIIYRRN